MALREILKIDTSTSNQIKLSSSINDTSETTAGESSNKNKRKINDDVSEAGEKEKEENEEEEVDDVKKLKIDVSETK